MTFKYKRDGTWQSGTVYVRQNGQWQQVIGSSSESTSSSTGDTTSGFDWSDTFTDTSWVTSAGDDLNVEKVTNLNSSGSGSLQGAINSASGPTVIVFEVGGVIDMRGSGDLDVTPNNVWIAGETAPDPGISIIGGGIVVDGSEVVVSHVGAFYGDEASDGEALKVYGDDVLFDHCTGLWGVDEVAGASDAVSRCSWINCIIAEGLFDGPHPEGQHSRGMLINDEGSTDLSVNGCLFASNNRRNPMTRGDMVIVNNYVWNFGNVAAHFNDPGFPDITAVGLHYEDGPNSDSDVPIFQYGANLCPEDIMAASSHDIDDGQSNILSSPPILPDGLDLSTALPANDVKAAVMGWAGQRPAARPPAEQAFISRVGSHGLVDSQNDVGGYPDYTSTQRTLDVPSTGLLSWIGGYTAEVE